MFDLPATDKQRLEVISRLARENFRRRAADYDRLAKFPAEDFADLFDASMHAPAVPTAYGGAGLGRDRGLFTLWMMTKELAKADMSLARCWEGHVNSQVLIAGIGSTQQQQRWLPEIVENGTLWVSWSGEPQSPTPERKQRVGTTVKHVNGGYIVNGTKVFATSAGHAQRAILLVNLHGPGGARHATNMAEGLLLLACDLTDPSITVEDSWWDPIGMRATVSHQVTFDQTFIPYTDQIGEPGQYLFEEWQTLFSPHYGATFLGGAESSLEYSLEYLQSQGKGQDPYVQQHIGRVSLNIETMHLWLHRTADLWNGGKIDQARQAGPRVRYLTEQLAMESLHECIKACGARCLNRPSPIERIYRDLSFYVRHDNSDHVLAAIGKSTLGQPHDPSFFNSSTLQFAETNEIHSSRGPSGELQ